MASTLDINVTYECPIGGLIPVSMERPGEKPQPIEKVLKALDTPGKGTCYICLVNGREEYIWHKNKRWFQYIGA